MLVNLGADNRHAVLGAPLTWLVWVADMGKPELAKLTAVEVRRLHELEIPGSQEPLLWQDIYKFIDKGILLGSSFLQGMGKRQLCVFVVCVCFTGQTLDMLWSVSKFSQLSIHHIYLVYAASSVTFEDSEKQKIYETISFDSLRAEVEELRVKRCSLCCYCFLSWLPFRQVQHRRCRKMI